MNRRYKDRLFYALFGSEERKRLTLELYNAINQTDYDNPDDLQLNTIEDVVYMGMKNDVSFLLASDLNMYEQQSTWNPNMPFAASSMRHMPWKNIFTTPGTPLGCLPLRS